jgi:hypothetical protein
MRLFSLLTLVSLTGSQVASAFPSNFGSVLAGDPNFIDTRPFEIKCRIDKPPSDGLAQDQDCLPIYPGVDKCRSQIRRFFQDRRMPRIGLYSTGWEQGQVNGAKGKRTVLDWAARQFGTRIKNRFGTFNNFIPFFWYQTKMDAVVTPFIMAGQTSMERSRFHALRDPVGKSCSQAMAEENVGNAYLAIPWQKMPRFKDGQDWDRNTAWGGWEYPALTRNPNIDAIYVVDPTDERRLPLTRIWKRGDPKDCFRPRGKISSWPVPGLPRGFGYSKMEWQKYDRSNVVRRALENTFAAGNSTCSPPMPESFSVAAGNMF